MVTEVLKRGAANATSKADLCRILDITAGELREAIERERRAGLPICANSTGNTGFYLAANKEELQRYCDILKQRAASIQKTRKACLLAMKSLPSRTEE